MAGVVADRNIRGRQRQADRSGERGGHRQIGRGARRGLREPIAFDDRHAGQRLPTLRDGLLHSHAATVRLDQLGEVERFEVGFVQQRVEHGVHTGERADRVALQGFDQPRQIARIRNQDAHAAATHRQQAADRQPKDVIQRQRDDHDELLDVGTPAIDRLAPQLRLQNVGDQIAVQQGGALRDAGGATGVLQHRHIVLRERDRCEARVRTTRDGIVQRNTRSWRHIVRNLRTTRAEHLADRGQHDMPDRRIRLHGLERLRERFEQHDRFRAAVVQLMLEFTRRVQRIDVHHHVTGTQDGRHGHRILQHIWQHHGNARPTRKA